MYNMFFTYNNGSLNLEVKKRSLQLNVFTDLNRNYSKMKFLLLIKILFV